MAQISYQPSEQKWDVPEGVYSARFLGEEKRPPYDGPSRFKSAPSTEPRYEWKFEITEGPARGKVIAWTTGSSPASPKSNCFKMVKWLLGRAPAPGEVVDTASFVDRLYEVTWELNPDSEMGNCRIAHLKLLSVGSAPASPTPARPAPAPASARPAPGRANAPPPKPVIQWWVDDGEEVQLRPESDVQQFVDAGKGEAIKLMAANQEGGWKTPAEVGFRTLSPEATGDIPF